jgi:hypothetical protein
MAHGTQRATWHAICNMQRATCNMQRATWHATCHMQHAAWRATYLMACTMQIGRGRGPASRDSGDLANRSIAARPAVCSCPCTCVAPTLNCLLPMCYDRWATTDFSRPGCAGSGLSVCCIQHLRDPLGLGRRCARVFAAEPVEVVDPELFRALAQVPQVDNCRMHPCQTPPLLIHAPLI